MHDFDGEIELLWLKESLFSPSEVGANIWCKRLTLKLEMKHETLSDNQQVQSIFWKAESPIEKDWINLLAILASTADISTGFRR